MNDTSGAPPTDGGRWPITACSSKACGAPLVWARTSNGARMPLDAHAVPDGKYRLVDDGGPEPRAVYAATDPATIAALLAGDEVPLHDSHFATCVQAAQFRLRQKGHRR